MTGTSIEATLELWASSLRAVKGRMRPLFRQERVAISAERFVDGLLGEERRKTGWMRAEAACDPGPWRQQAILGRGRWDADALRDGRCSIWRRANTKRGRLSECTICRSVDARLVLAMRRWCCRWRRAKAVEFVQFSAAFPPIRLPSPPWNAASVPEEKAASVDGGLVTSVQRGDRLVVV